MHIPSRLSKAIQIDSLIATIGFCTADTWTIQKLPTFLFGLCKRSTRRKPFSRSCSLGCDGRATCPDLSLVASLPFRWVVSFSGRRASGLQPWRETLQSHAAFDCSSVHIGRLTHSLFAASFGLLLRNVFRFHLNCLTKKKALWYINNLRLNSTLKSFRWTKIIGNLYFQKQAVPFLRVSLPPRTFRLFRVQHTAYSCAGLEGVG